MRALINDIGAFLKGKRGVSPAARAAGTFNGPGLDRLTFNNPQSCALIAVSGAETGAPTARSVQAKLQHSSDNGVGDAYADFGGAGVTVSAIDSEGQADYNLAGAKQWVRAVEVVTFTGGTSPTLECATAIAFGGSEEVPA